MRKYGLHKNAAVEAETYRIAQVFEGTAMRKVGYSEKQGGTRYIIAAAKTIPQVARRTLADKYAADYKANVAAYKAKVSK